MVRYNSNGSIDKSFGEKGKVVVNTQLSNAELHAVALQSDGKIIMAGWFAPNLYANILLARYTTTGNLDSTFGDSGIVVTSIKRWDYINAMVIQPDDKIVITGTTQQQASIQNLSFTLRYNPDGSMDKSFGDQGKVITHFDGPVEINAVALQTDGKIVIGGNYKTKATNPQFILVRYTTDGKIDLSFGNNGVGTAFIGNNYTYAKLNSLAVQQNGKIVAAGTPQISNYITNATLVRFKDNGTIDNSFGSNGIVVAKFGSGSSEGKTVLIQSDRKIVVAGRYYILGDFSYFAVARYQTNGTLDSTFGINGIETTDVGQNAKCGDALLQPDGKIVVGGYILTSHRNPQKFVLVLYNGGSAQLISKNIYSANIKAVKQISLKLYPNPAKDFITISGLSINNTSTISVIDINGKLLQKIFARASSYQLNIAALAKGVYFIKIQNRYQTSTQKFVKE